MKVFVIGASGRVGKEVVERLAKRGNEVLAGCRKPREVTCPEGTTPVEFDLHWDATKMVDSLKGGSNPIPDVAEVLVSVLDHPNTIGKVIMMKTGDTPIDVALSEI